MPPRISISSSLCSLSSRPRCLFGIDESASSLVLQTSIRPSQPSPISRPSQQQTRTIKSILKPPPKANRFDTSLGLSPSAISRSAVLERREHTLPYRTGVLAVKKGMSSMYATVEGQPGAKKTGHRIPVTILQLDRCQVMGHKTLPRHGYWAVQMGHGWRHPDNLNRPELGHLAASELPPKERVMEFRIKGEEGLVPVGVELRADWFKTGQFVDVRSKNKGKGFAGGMKKHGWSGQPASHGQSLTHRTMGSAGGSQGSGSRVIPGKAMAGRMGNEFHTIQNLKVVMVDEANGIIAVKGCVGGPIGRIVQIQDAKKMPEQREKLDLPLLPQSLSAEAAQEAAIADVSL